MNNPNQDKDHKEEESSGKKEEKDSSDIRRENKPSRSCAFYSIRRDLLSRWK